MKIAVLSDLHLKSDQVTLRRKFVKLLDALREEAKISDLWLLGDIFDLLIGPFDFWREQYSDIFEGLAKIRKAGIKVLWLEGNHDFHIQEFLDKIGIDVADGEITYLGSQAQKIYLAHGDLVNHDDQLYLKWRNITRSKVFRRALDFTPNFVAKKYLLPFAEKRSASSRAHHIDRQYPRLREMYRSFAQKKFEGGFSAVFMGHCHVEDFFIEGKNFYINLGSALDGTLRYALWDLEKDRFPKCLEYPKIEP